MTTRTLPPRLQRLQQVDYPRFKAACRKGGLRAAQTRARQLKQQAIEADILADIATQKMLYAASKAAYERRDFLLPDDDQ